MRNEAQVPSPPASAGLAGEVPERPPGQRVARRAAHDDLSLLPAVLLELRATRAHVRRVPPPLTARRARITGCPRKSSTSAPPSVGLSCDQGPIPTAAGAAYADQPAESLPGGRDDERRDDRKDQVWSVRPGLRRCRGTDYRLRVGRLDHGGHSPRQHGQGGRRQSGGHLRRAVHEADGLRGEAQGIRGSESLDAARVHREGRLGQDARPGEGQRGRGPRLRRRSRPSRQELTSMPPEFPPGALQRLVHHGGGAL